MSGLLLTPGVLTKDNGRSDVSSTQEVAIDEVTELALEDDHLRRLLHDAGIRTIGLLRQDPQIWYNMPKSIHTKAQKALISLAEEAASIKSLVQSLEMCPQDTWPSVKSKLEACLTYVLCR